MSVLVYIIMTEDVPIEPNTNCLKALFSDPYFIVEIVTGKEEKNKKNINYLRNKTIELAQKTDSSLYSISILDSSISSLSPTDMKSTIQTVIDKSGTDLYYLCKWQDSCEKLQDVPGVEYINCNSVLKYTFNPQGAQAVMYSPFARSVITGQTPMRNGQQFNTSISFPTALTQAVNSGGLTASTSVPNIVNFDIEQSTSNSDFAKLNECNLNSGSTSSNNSAFYWFILIVIILIVVSYAVINIGKY